MSVRLLKGMVLYAGIFGLGYVIGRMIGSRPL